MPEPLTCTLNGNVPVFRFGAYFDEVCGKALNQAADEHLCAGRVAMVFDFSGCKVINSPGVGRLLEVVLKVGNDFQGTVVLTGLDPLKRRVFQMATILPLARETTTLEEAVRHLSGG